MANSGADLNGRITYLGNFQYQVELFFEGQWQNFAVHFDGIYNTGWGDNPGPAWDGGNIWYDPAPKGEEFWTILFQRAYHDLLVKIPGKQLTQDYALALKSLTGDSVDSNDWDPESLAWLIDQGKAVIAGDADDEDKTIPNHCYAVLDVYNNGQEWWVVLYNPWGKDNEEGGDGVIYMTWDDFYGNKFDFDVLYFTC